ncbi:ABC transporter permease [Fibrobacter sp.]|uniref:ABC transporter permease n=1 Tax=Fibrobacter sp. TaxID=35828 RepID=UPI00386C1D82
MNKTDFNLIIENYLRNPFRSFGLSLLIALLASVLLVGGLLSLSLSKGLNRLSSRLGADVIVIPQGSEINDQTILLQGDSKYAYLPQGALEFIRGLAGVEQATPQFFLTTLSSSCCEQKVMIIGFDPASDFVIQPWIREVLTDKLPKGAIVVGSDISVGEKKTVKFFDHEYPVAASLEPVGNKLDQAVFVDVATLAQIREAAKAKGVVFLHQDVRSDGSDAPLYSSVLIKLRAGADIDRLSQEIHTRFDGVQIRTRKDLFSGLEKSANFLQIVVWSIVGLFLVIAVAAIVISFSLSTRERRREYALLRIVGYARKRLRTLVLGESLLVSAVGTYIGLLFSSVAFFTFKIWIGEHVSVPFIVPGNAEIAAVYAVVILLLHSVGPVAVYGVANKVSKIDAYAALREVEH